MWQKVGRGDPGIWIADKFYQILHKKNIVFIFHILLQLKSGNKVRYNH